MVRNSGLSGLRRERRRPCEVNPMEGIANLADVMLVFACGLMVSIILFWNVNLSDVTAVISKDQLAEVEDAEQLLEDGKLSSALESKGVAYEDPETGKMYIIMPK